MYISRESKNAIGDVYQDNNGNKTILFINKKCYLFLNTSLKKKFDAVSCYKTGNMLMTIYQVHTTFAGLYT